jgi:hypothetical protein
MLKCSRRLGWAAPGRQRRSWTLSLFVNLEQLVFIINQIG